MIKVMRHFIFNELREYKNFKLRVVKYKYIYINTKIIYF